MDVQQDFKEPLHLFNETGVEPIYLISKDDFIRNKRASGRYKDLADIEALGETP